MTSPWGALATYRKRQRQDFKVYLTKGRQVNPKAYCCDSNTINDAKPPVAILTATPNPILEGETCTLDLSASYDPDGVGIPDPGGYEIWDGIGGNYPATKTQPVVYPVGGRYEAQGVVTDATGLKGQASTWVEVLSGEPGPNPPEPPGDWRKKIYVATKLNGIYYTEDFSEPGGPQPTWGTVNAGLGALTTYAIVGDPWDVAYHQYCRTLEPKIYRRTGGGSWGVILDAAIVQAVTGCGTTDDLKMMGPECNINAQGHVYALVYFYDGGAFGNRLFFFKSVDYGDNWTAVEIINHWTVPVVPWFLRVGALRGTSPFQAGYVIYAGFQRTATALGMRVSTDQGATWGGTIDLYHCGLSGIWVDLARSPADQDIIYQAGRGVIALNMYHTLVKSIDRGGTFTELWACALTPTMTQRPGVYIWDPLSAFMAAGEDGLHWTEDDWATYVTHDFANFNVAGCSRVMDAPENLYGSLAGNPPAAPHLQHVIAVSADRGVGWEGKAGANCATPPYTDSIPNNCGGIADILQIWTEE